MKTKKRKTPAKSRLARQAERAMREAVAKVVEECESKGLRLPVWKNNKAVLLPLKKIK